MDPNLPIKQESFDEDFDLTQDPSTKLKFYFKFPECPANESLENDIKIEEKFISDSNSIYDDISLNSVCENIISKDYSSTLMSENTSSVIFNDSFHGNISSKVLSPKKSICTNSPSSIKDNANEETLIIKDLGNINRNRNQIIIKGNKNVKSYNTFTCEICKSTISSSHNLKEHFHFFHIEFLEFRAKTYCITIEDALQDTYTNHVSELSPWPSEIVTKYQRIRIENKRKKGVSSDTKEFDILSENHSTTFRKLTSCVKDGTCNEQANKHSNVLTEKRMSGECQVLFSDNIKSDANSSLGAVDGCQISKALMSENTSSVVKDGNGLSDVNILNDSFHENIISKDLNSKKNIYTNTPSSINDNANEERLFIKDLGNLKRKRKPNKKYICLGPIKEHSTQPRTKSKRKFTEKCSIICEICNHKLLARDLKVHLRLKHTDFLNFRANKYQITEAESIQATYENHILLSSPWPDGILANFWAKNIQEKGDSSDIKETDDSNTIFSKVSKIPGDIEDSEGIEQLRSIEIDKNTIEQTVIENKTLTERKIITDFEEKQHRTKSKRKIAGRCSIICEICNHKLLARNLKQHLRLQHTDFLNFRAKKYEITEAESIQATYENHILLSSPWPYGILANFWAKNIREEGESSDKKETDNSNTIFLKDTKIEDSEGIEQLRSIEIDKKETDDSNTIFSKVSKIPGGIEDSESIKQLRSIEIDKNTIEQTVIENKKRKIITDFEDKQKLGQPKNKSRGYKIRKTLFKRKYKKFDRKLLEDFFYKEDNGKEIWFCATCHRHNPKVTPRDNKRRTWHYTGISGYQPMYALKDAMIKHLRSETHKKYKEKAIECQAVTSEALSMKIIENLCITAQFFASHNFTQSSYPKQFEFLYKINENLGLSNKSKIHPLGNTHYDTVDIIEAQKACFLAVQDQMRDEDMNIFPPTGLLPRYTLVCGKATVKDRQRLIIIMRKIDYKTGTSKEYLLNASLIPRGACKVLELVTKETKKLISTKRIAFSSCDKESINAVENFGVDIRMDKDNNYSDKIINLADVRPNIDKILFSASKAFPEHVKNEKWVVDTYIKAKEIIGCVLTHPNVSKILREYSNVGIENNIRYHPFQQKNSSISLNFLLKNLEIMIKVLPEVASENSMSDILTKDVASRILSQIQDPLFITRLVLLDKVFHHVLVLEITSQNVNVGPFEYIRTKNNLIKSLQYTRLIHEDEIKNIVENGTFEFKYRFRKKIKTNTVTVDLQNINMSGQPWRCTKMLEKDCCELFTKWVDNIILRLDSYMTVPECMRLAFNIFTLSEKEFSSEQFYEKLKDLKSFFLIVNTDFEECGEDCEGIKDCLCLSNQFKRFLEHVRERKSKCTNIGETDYVELYKFYLCELNSDYLKELNIRNVLRALEITLLMKPSQFGIEQVLSEVKKTICSISGKVIKDDMVNINVFLRMNSSVEMIDAELASSKYRESNSIQNEMCLYH